MGERVLLKLSRVTLGSPSALYRIWFQLIVESSFEISPILVEKFGLSGLKIFVLCLYKLCFLGR